MYFDGDFTLLAKVDIQALAARVSTFSEEEWQADSHRQQTYAPHKQTHTIPLIFDDDLRHEYATHYPLMSQLSDLLAPVQTAITQYFSSNARRRTLARRFGEPYFQRLILVRLASAGVISPHQDHGYSLARCHRIHLPLVSHDKVHFQVGDSERCLLPGELWEINNRRIHGVRNLGTTPRIHLIADYVIPGEKIFEPDAVLQA